MIPSLPMYFIRGIRVQSKIVDHMANLQLDLKKSDHPIIDSFNTGTILLDDIS